MKRILLGVTLLLALSISSLGQFNSRTTYVSAATRGNFGFTHRPNDFDYHENSIQIGFSPEAGYFINNKIALGLSGLLDIDRILGESGYSEYRIVFGPNIRYYLPGESNMKAFFYGFGGYGFLPDENLFKIMLGPGINFFFTKQITFESKVLYSFAREWNTTSGVHHHIHDLTLMIGLSLFFSGSE